MFALVPLFSVLAARYGWRAGYIGLSVAVIVLALPAVLILRRKVPAAGSKRSGSNRSATRSAGGCAQCSSSSSSTATAAGATNTSSLSSVELTIHSDGQPLKGVERSATGASAAAPCAAPPFVAAPSTATVGTAVDSAAASPAAADGTSATATEAATSAATVTTTPPPLRTKLRTLLWSRNYWLLSLAFVVCGLTTTGFIETHLVALAVSYGHTNTTGALAFSVLSAANGVGMLTAGWLSDRVSRSLTLSIIFAVRGASFLVLLSFRSEQMLFVFAVMFGLVDYSVVPPVVSLVGSHAGQHTVGLGVGILLAWHSMAAAIGAYLGGELYQQQGHYDMALQACAATCLVAAIASLGVCPEPLVRKRIL